MSRSDRSAIPVGATAAPGRKGFLIRRLGAWMAVSCLLLGASGAVRAWQDQQFGVVVQGSEACPFPLKSLPRVLGRWEAPEGADQTLDALTLRIAGGADHIIRTYSDRATGVSLDVMVIYGPAEQISPHTPEVCFPSFGYTNSGPSSHCTVRSADLPATFRSSVYARESAGRVDRQEVYWALRTEQLWTPDVSSGRRVNRSPGMFKVQVQRRIGETERRDRDNPTEAFLELLIPEIERTLERSKPS